MLQTPALGLGREQVKSRGGRCQSLLAPEVNPRLGLHALLKPVASLPRPVRLSLVVRLHRNVRVRNIMPLNNGFRSKLSVLLTVSCLLLPWIPQGK